MLARYILGLALLAASTQVLAAPMPQEGGQAPAPQDGGGQPTAPQGDQGQAPAPQGDGQSSQPQDGGQQSSPSQTDAAPSGSASDSQPSASSSSEPDPPAQLSGEIFSDIPLSCVAGCSLSQSLYEDCVGGDNPSCSRFCTTANYTQALTCLNCLVTQGSSLSGDQISSALNAYTAACKRVRGSRFQGTPSLTAGATTTEGTSTSLGEGQGLPTWEGFSLASDVAVPTDVSKIGERIGNNRQQS